VARIQEETDSLQKEEAGPWKEQLDNVEEDLLSARFGLFLLAYSNSGVVLDGIGRLYSLGGAFDCRRVGASVGENSSSRLFPGNPHDHFFWQSESDMPGDTRILRMASLRKHETAAGSCGNEGVILHTCYTT
jgi:hypothetical protein